MPQKIILDNNSFTIIHRTNKKIKRISLVLENKDEIIIKTPLKFKVHKIKDIILEHKEWILKSIQKVKPKHKFDFITGGKIPFLGILYPIYFQIDNNIKYVKFIFENNTFIIKHNQNAIYDDFLDGLEKFYKYNAKKIINPIFDKLILKTELKPSKIGYRKAKTRWGSCSRDNSISINYMLLQFSEDIIEYVVLHELCHIIHKNHSKKFWDLVAFYMPNYKQVKLKL